MSLVDHCKDAVPDKEIKEVHYLLKITHVRDTRVWLSSKPN